MLIIICFKLINLPNRNCIFYKKLTLIFTIFKIHICFSKEEGDNPLSSNVSQTRWY